MPEHDELPFLYASGELDPAGRAEFERHLAACAACRAALEGGRWGSRLAAAAAREPDPALVERAIRAALAPAGEGTGAGGFWAALRPAALGLGLGLALLVFLVRVARVPREAPAWPNGLERELAALEDDLGALEARLSPEAAAASWSADFEDALSELDLRRGALEEQLGARTQGG